MPEQFGAFLGVSILLIVTPGPDMALVMRNALRGGRTAAVATGWGVVAGLVVWTLAASVGLATLLVASEPAFVAVKLVGAAYLIYLGTQALWSARRAGGQHESLSDQSGGRRTSALKAARQGLLCNLGNPKAGVIFTSFLPQFLPEGGASFSALLLLGLIFCTLGFLWLTFYATVVARLGDVLRRPRIRRTIEALTGGVLIALGLRLTTAHR